MCKNLQIHRKDNQLHSQLEYTCRIFQANPLSVKNEKMFLIRCTISKFNTVCIKSYMIPDPKNVFLKNNSFGSNLKFKNLNSKFKIYVWL